MVAQRLNTLPNGLYRPMGGKYLLQRIDNRVVRRIPLDSDIAYTLKTIDDVGHVYVTPIQLPRKERRNDKGS